MNYAKLAIYAAVFVLIGWGLYAFGHHEFHAGVNSVTAAAAEVDQRQAAKAHAADQSQAAGFVLLDSTYQKSIANAQASPDPFLARVNNSASGLRPAWQCQAVSPSGSGKAAVPHAPATSGGRDGAAAASAQYGGSLVQSILPIGHDADQREAELRARIAYLEGLLLKEREGGP